MDSQRPFLYLTLLFMLFLIWSTWQQDHAPKPPTPVVSTANPATTGSTNNADLPSQAGVLPGQSATGKGQIITVKTDKLLLHINTQGGEIVEADLPTYPVSVDQPNVPVKILDLATRNYVAQSGLQHQPITGQDVSNFAPNHTTQYSTPQTDYVLANDKNEVVVPMAWDSPNGVTVIKRFIFKRGSFLVNVEHEVQNRSNSVWSGTEYRQLKHGTPPKGGSFLTGAQAYVGGAYYHDGKYKKVSFSDMQEHNLSESTVGGWVAMQEHYFLSAWVPPKDAEQYYSMVTQNQGVPGYVLGIRSPMKQIASGSTDTFKSEFYVGPKDQDTLKQIADGLDLTVDYGVLAFISKPLFWLMKFIHSFLGNWGWTIVMLTFVVKLIFFYPSAMSYKSMAKMKAVSPKLKDINERYTDDPQGKQKAMVDLYRKEKINPLGGCLPILIQIPVFMGLYWVLLESVELRQAPWILWYKDLSVRDPYFVLPIIMGATMYLQQLLNPPQVDPMQQKIFQFMPIIFTVMFLFFPSGLVLYWVVNNILSMAQQWYINKKIIGHA